MQSIRENKHQYISITGRATNQIQVTIVNEVAGQVVISIATADRLDEIRIETRLKVFA